MLENQLNEHSLKFKIDKLTYSKRRVEKRITLSKTIVQKGWAYPYVDPVKPQTTNS